MIVDDQREHSPAARERKLRTRTALIIIHRTVGLDLDGDGRATSADVARFFTQDPEGIATVVLGGSYADKVPIIKTWRENGVPARYQGTGFCPYHYLVDATGGISQMLDRGCVGAHAGALNDRSVAVAAIGDFRTAEPPLALVEGVVAVVADLLRAYPEVMIIDHDEANRRQGLPQKGCVGAKFPLSFVIQRARALQVA